MEQYIINLIKSLQTLDLRILDKIVEKLKKARNIYLMGNGGSAATASHFACDLVNMAELKAFSLTDNVSIITATANDFEYEDIFSRFLERYLTSKDVVVLFSCSGESKNILEAVFCAKYKKSFSIAFTRSSGMLRKMADLVVDVNETNIQMIEDIHLILCHMISLEISKCKA